MNLEQLKEKYEKYAYKVGYYTYEQEDFKKATYNVNRANEIGLFIYKYLKRMDIIEEYMNNKEIYIKLFSMFFVFHQTHNKSIVKQIEEYTKRKDLIGHYCREFIYAYKMGGLTSKEFINANLLEEEKLLKKYLKKNNLI